jgi:nucleoside-diphosphate-sugar epimerase
LHRKSVVIFGSSGFIGNELTDHFLKSGYHVICADINKSETLKDVSFHYCDIREPIVIGTESTPDLVINLAAVHRTPGHLPREYYETNVVGSINILDWAEALGVKSLFFMSSIAVYGTSINPITEKSETRPESDYGLSKLIAEKLYLDWQKSTVSDRYLVICRASVIFGPKENGNFTRLAKALKHGYFIIPGNKSVVKSCGYVKDLIKSIQFTTDKKKNVLLYNFAFPEVYNIGNICEAFADIAGYKKPISLRISAFARIAAIFPAPIGNIGIRMLKLVHGNLVIPQILKEMNFEWNFDLKAAINDWKRLANGQFK